MEEILEQRAEIGPVDQSWAAHAAKLVDIPGTLNFVELRFVIFCFTGNVNPLLPYDIADILPYG